MVFNRSEVKKKRVAVIRVFLVLNSNSKNLLFAATSTSDSENLQSLHFSKLS